MVLPNLSVMVLLLLLMLWWWWLLLKDLGYKVTKLRDSNATYRDNVL
jgi:hypothetical protein